MQINFSESMNITYRTQDRTPPEMFHEMNKKLKVIAQSLQNDSATGDDLYENIRVNIGGDEYNPK